MRKHFWEKAACSLPIYTLVGAKRWPYEGNHPDCWRKPIAGVLLPLNDVRAWRNTLAFPNGTPSQEAVDAHCAKVLKDHGERGESPVIWYGQDGCFIHWEFHENLRPYADDVKAWEEARQLEYEVRTPCTTKP